MLIYGTEVGREGCDGHPSRCLRVTLARKVSDGNLRRFLTGPVSFSSPSLHTFYLPTTSDVSIRWLNRHHHHHRRRRRRSTCEESWLIVNEANTSSDYTREMTVERARVTEKRNNGWRSNPTGIDWYEAWEEERLNRTFLSCLESFRSNRNQCSNLSKSISIEQANRCISTASTDVEMDTNSRTKRTNLSWLPFGEGQICKILFDDEG